MEKEFICVFGSSSANIHTKFLTAAYELGQLLGEAEFGCINGAGASGIMGAVSNGILDHGGEVLGIIPQFMVDNNWLYDRLTQVRIVKDMHARKQMMARLSEAFIAMPGGYGTLEELLEIITWKQLGLHNKKIIILNIDGFYDPLVDQFSRCLSGKMMRPEDKNLWEIASSPQEALQLVASSL